MIVWRELGNLQLSFLKKTCCFLAEITDFFKMLKASVRVHPYVLCCGSRYPEIRKLFFTQQLR